MSPWVNQISSALELLSRAGTSAYPNALAPLLLRLVQSDELADQMRGSFHGTGLLVHVSTNITSTDRDSKITRPATHFPEVKVEIINLEVKKQTTTDGPRGPGGSSFVQGGRDESESHSQKRRWIPPSTVHRDAVNEKARNDLIFRKVRGILNKLTPEKFQKLSDDLLQTELNSSVILKGVILLIFEKALDEPKYSSMYAQLCKRLSDEAPNYEEDSTRSTFRILLLNKCRAEFESRSEANEAFNRNRNGTLSPEEEERRQIAKRKMLGNIKFIGELGKLEICSEAILHHCIHQLLQEKNKQALGVNGMREATLKDMAEDLECLCQIMRTCGRILDQKGQKLMDQYFERMVRHSECFDQLPIRIRFMLRDVIELRRDKWIPRKATNVEGPMPIHQIRDEDPRGPQRGYGPHMNPPHGDVFPRKTRGGGLDMFGSGNFQNLGSSPSSLGSKFDSFGDSHDGYHQGFRNQRGGSRPSQNFYPNRGGDGNGNGGQNRGQYQQNRSKQNHNDNNSQLQNFNNAGGNKELPPRFKNKIMMAHSHGPTNLEDLSLRPPSHSLYKQVPKSLPQPNSVVNRHGDTHSPRARQLTPSLPLLEDSPVLIKQVSVEKKLPKKDKGPSKEEILKKMESIVNDYLASGAVQDAVGAYKEQKVPEKFIRCVLVFIMSQPLDKTDADRELVIKLVVQLKKATLITSVQFMDAYRELTVLFAEKEKEIPRVLSHLAGYAAHAIAEEISSLAEFSNELEFGAHFPLFMLILQQLSKTQGKVKLTEIYNDSKVNLLNQLPEVDRTKDRLAEILEDRGLTFLIPLLRIQAELWKQLQSDPNPMQFYKWIKENLDVVHHTDKGFISALVAVLLKYITQETTLLDWSDKTAVPDKAMIDKERFLLDKFKAVLQAFLHNEILLQVVAVYSLQVYCYSLQFPKGMLLRWFMTLYDLEVIEEEAFLKWKEDISDDYPGKGQALFQVNNWLTWLEQAESEEEDDEET